MTIKVDLDDKIYKATQMYLKKKGAELDLQQLVEKAAKESLDKAFNKYVPKDVKEFLFSEEQL